MKHFTIEARGASREERQITLRSKREYLRFFAHLPLLREIREIAPASLYEFAIATGRDVSNLHKVMKFYQNLGVVELASTSLGKRRRTQPKVLLYQFSLELSARSPPNRRTYLSVSRGR